MGPFFTVDKVSILEDEIRHRTISDLPTEVFE